MRILVVIPHYFGPSLPEYRSQALGSCIEPIGRIAALNEMIVALQGQFAANRYTFEGDPIVADDAERRVDIVIMTMRDHNILPQLGLAPTTFETIYVEGNPTTIGFQAHLLLRDRLGMYDLYCLAEDDLIIRDPAFFEKVVWFQRNFGPKALLAPTRFELASTGTPAKVIIDPKLPDNWSDPFRRPNQKSELEEVWRESRQTFHLPSNPHSGCFFLTQEQMAYWIEQPTFGDRDTSWVGPLESAATLSIGKVFDIYKSAAPDRFFFEIQHFGARYAAQYPPPGSRHGEPPLLAIAQNALRAALHPMPGGKHATANNDGNEHFARLVEQWIAQGTAVEHRGQLDAMIRNLDAKRQQIEALTAEIEQLRAASIDLAERKDPRSLRRRIERLSPVRLFRFLSSR